MARPTKDTRGVAKAQREHERRIKKAAKLEKRREAREQRPEPERAGQGPQTSERVR